MRGLLVQLQVIHALFLRETRTRYGDNHLGYAWALLEPTLFFLVFLGLSAVGRRTAPPGMAIGPFLVTGIVTYLGFRHTSQQTTQAIEANTGLLFFPQVRPLDLVMARALLEVVTQLVVFTLLMTAVVWWEGGVRINNLLETLLGLGLAGALGASFGLLRCGLLAIFPVVERMIGPLQRPLLFLSAVFHPVEGLPTEIRDILLYNPIVHVIETVREGWFPGYHSPHVTPWYPLKWILVMTFFGLSLERVVRKRLQP